MNILFTHCWQTGNSGDVAIWKSMALHLKEKFPSASFIICSQKRENWDVNQLEDAVGAISVFPLCSKDALNKADVVINQGGGYMTRSAMKPHFEFMKKAQDRGKPTFWGSQTFLGKINSEVKRLGKEVLNNSLLVAARERQTYEYITEYIGAKGGHIKILPDGVFTVEARSYKKSLPPGAVKIGIRGYKATPRLIKEVALFADMAVEALGPVVFIPIGHGEIRDDRQQAKEVVELMRHDAVVVDEKISAEQTLDILKDGILVSDRYHGIVYSASVCTPFVPMTPDIGHKMPGLLETIDYPFRKVLSTGTVTADEIFEYAAKVVKQKEEIKSHLETVVPRVRDRAESTYGFIVKGIEENANF